MNWEQEQLIEEVRRAAGAVRTVVEVGTFRGDSLRRWRAAFDPDLMIGIQDTDETTPQTAAELGVHLVVGKSQDTHVYRRVREILDGRSIDFLYIDGDHRYGPVCTDWELYSPLVAMDGVVALHDAVIEDNETVEVFRLYRELRLGRRSKLVYDGEGTGVALVFFGGRRLV